MPFDSSLDLLLVGIGPYYKTVAAALIGDSGHLFGNKWLN